MVQIRMSPLAARAGNLAILCLSVGNLAVAFPLLAFQRNLGQGLVVHPSLLPSVLGELDAVEDGLQYEMQHRKGWRRN